MAQIIPEDSLTASYPGPELHHCIEQLSSDFEAQQQLTSDIETTGLRYWVSHGKKSALIATLPQDAINKAKPLSYQILHSHPLVFELIEERNSLLPELLRDHAHHLLPIILLLPENLEPKQTIHLKEQGLLAIGSILLENAMPVVLERCLGMTASTQVIKLIHGNFNPELAINHQKQNPPPTPKLLNLEQQRGLTVDLNKLKKNQPFSLRLVLGLSGSGKSLILAKRAAMLANRNPKSKILVLSLNKATNNQLKQQISSLSKHASSIHCHPFLEWCRKLLGGTRQFVFEDQEPELFDLMIKRHFENADLSRYGLIKEVNYIKDRMITSEAEYLTTLRSNQSLALSNPIRKRIWQASVEIDTHLRDRNCYLWADAPAFLLKEFDEGKTFEPYQYVLIDEAQYFAPSWIKLIKRAMSNHSQLFMTADPDQGFYNRSLNWKETGLDLRDRTIRLTKNYRCSPAISKVVDSFRLHRLMEQTHFPLYSINHIEPIPPEDHPQLLHFPTIEDQQNRLFSEINQLLKQGYSADDILILNAGKQNTRFMAQEIRQALNISATTLTGSLPTTDKSLKLCDLEVATGLESKVVFITGLEKIFNLETDKAISEREQHSLRNTNTHMLHMAMTRASERLYLLITTPKIPEELIIEGLDIPTFSAEHRAPVMYINQ